MRLAEEKRKAEEKRLAEEKRKAEEKRLAEEKRKEEEKRLAEEKRKAAEKRLAEEKRRADEKRQAEARLQGAMDRAIMDAALEQSSQEAENGALGGNGDGIGILGDYIDSVRSRIKPYLTTRPRADGRIFETRVRLDIAEDGTITKATILESSGDAAFDSDVMRAIREAGKMEPPQLPEHRSLTIPFNSIV